jgi:hypothetical protein
MDNKECKYCKHFPKVVLLRNLSNSTKSIQNLSVIFNIYNYKIIVKYLKKID